jgi:hypothetical protein
MVFSQISGRDLQVWEAVSLGLWSRDIERFVNPNARLRCVLNLQLRIDPTSIPNVASASCYQLSMGHMF